jgi:diaminopimelate epimerase
MEQCPEDPSSLSKRLSDRHFGIGSDGLVLIMLSRTADFRMRMFNSDGSEAEMCGNASRCVGKYVYDKGLTDKKTVTMETPAGIKILELTVENDKVTLVRVDMGEPVLTPVDIPVKSNKDLFIAEPITIKDRTFRVTCVSMGNPHAVSYVEDVANFPLEVYGPIMETNELYPRKINSEFVEVIDRKTLKMRVWERGAGETLACGTGACAVAVASVLNGLCDRNVTVKLLGGDLTIEWNEKDNHVYKTGPAVTVFDGEVE